MQIKKKLQNEYLVTPSGIMVRNFFKNSNPLDINNLSSTDYDVFLKNEITNVRKRYPQIDSVPEKFKKVVIVSDGYKFDEKHKLTLALPKDVAIIGVNRSLAKWKLVGNNLPASEKRLMNYYVVNNPYDDCLKYIPTDHGYTPKCVASTRTSPKFMEAYKGNKYLYAPTRDEFYSGPTTNAIRFIDDYRNCICAALSLAALFNVEKLLLLCCDDSFENERPGAVKLPNGLWCYDQHLVSNSIIDAKLHWMKQAGIQIKSHSSGLNYKNASYINEEDIVTFLKE